MRTLLILSSLSLPLYSSAPSAAAPQGDPIKEKWNKLIGDAVATKKIADKESKSTAEAKETAEAAHDKASTAVLAEFASTLERQSIASEKMLQAQLEANRIAKDFVAVFSALVFSPAKPLATTPATKPSATNSAAAPAKPKTMPSAQPSKQAYYHVSGCSDGAAL